MGRPKSDNPLEIVSIRMDRNLYKQLKKYADRNDKGIASESARKAIKQFIEENKAKK